MRYPQNITKQAIFQKTNDIKVRYSVEDALSQLASSQMNTVNSLNLMLKVLSEIRDELKRERPVQMIAPAPIPSFQASIPELPVPSVRFMDSKELEIESALLGSNLKVNK